MSNNGFSLIEVMISLLIISLGLLAIAGLEISALRNTQESYWQSIATVQMASILERLRVNHSTLMEQRECHNWQIQNQLLLSKSSSDCICDKKICQLVLTWKNQHLNMQLLRS